MVLQVEMPEGEARHTQLLERMAKRFPVGEFNKARAALDPKNIMSNELVDAIFPRSPQSMWDSVRGWLRYRVLVRVRLCQLSCL